MREKRGRMVPALFARALIALVCALSLTLGVAGLSQARGAKGTQSTRSTPILIMVQPASAHAPAGICPYATLFTGAVTKQDIILCPSSGIEAVSYTLAEEIAPSSLSYNAPFRPPRTV